MAAIFFKMELLQYIEKSKFDWFEKVQFQEIEKAYCILVISMFPIFLFFFFCVWLSGLNDILGRFPGQKRDCWFLAEVCALWVLLFFIVFTQWLKSVTVTSCSSPHFCCPSFSLYIYVFLSIKEGSSRT